jgi:hypothetical protein
MTQAIAASSFAVSDLHYPTRIDREPPRGGRGKRGSVRRVRRRRIPLRIRDLEPAARLDIRDLHEPLALAASSSCITMGMAAMMAAIARARPLILSWRWA